MPVGKVTTTPSPPIMPQPSQTQSPHGPADQGVARLTPQLPQTQSLHGPAGQGATRLNRECADSADLMETITKGYKDLADKVAENNDKYEHFLQQDENKPKVLGSKALFGLVSPVASGAERLLHLQEGSLTGNKLASKTQLVRSLRAQVEALHGLKAAIEELNNRIGAVPNKKALTPQQQQTLSQQVAEVEQQLSAFQCTIDLTAADEAPGQMFEPVDALNRMANNMQRSLREYQISITEGNCLPDLSAIAENVPVGGNMEQRAGAHVQSHLPPNPTTGMKPSFPGFRPVESHVPPEPATETTDVGELGWMGHLETPTGKELLEEMSFLYGICSDLDDDLRNEGADTDVLRNRYADTQFTKFSRAVESLVHSKSKVTVNDTPVTFLELCSDGGESEERRQEVADALENNQELREWAIEGSKLLREISEVQERYNTRAELFADKPALKLKRLQIRIRHLVES